MANLLHVQRCAASDFGVGTAAVHGHFGEGRLTAPGNDAHYDCGILRGTSRTARTSSEEYPRCREGSKRLWVHIFEFMVRVSFQSTLTPEFTYTRRTDASLCVHQVRGPIFQGFKNLKDAILYMVKYSHPSYASLRPTTYTDPPDASTLLSKLEGMVLASKTDNSSRDTTVPSEDVEPSPTDSQPTREPSPPKPIPAQQPSPTKSSKPSPTQSSKPSSSRPAHTLPTRVPSPSKKFVPTEPTVLETRESTTRPSSPKKGQPKFPPLATDTKLVPAAGSPSMLLPAPLPFGVKNLPTRSTPLLPLKSGTSRSSSPVKSGLGTWLAPVEIDSDDDEKTTTQDESKGKSTAPRSAAALASSRASQFSSGILERKLIRFSHLSLY